MEKQRNPEQPRGETTSHNAQSADYSEDGVDLTLIRWMLSLTSAERLEVLQSAVNSLARLSDGAIGY